MLSYNQKNNLANGHQNQDGAGENFSFNYGIEGDTEDPKISRIRIRQAKNFLAVLFLSQGVPLILGGDEFLRTQKGNNNPYCQDNEISWYHWDWWKKNAELFRFCRLLIRFRLHHSSLRRQKFFSGEDHNGDYSSDVIWYSSDGRFQDWRGENRTLACFLDGTYQETGAQKNDNDMYFMFNANAVPIYFKLPKLNGKKWFCALDNGKDTPEDIYPPGEEKMITGLGVYRVSPRCTVVLIAK
jgi:glycogen operon protein